VTSDPFTALGLPARADLTDDDVRAAWRRIAAATHPDRADGGDPGRYAVAAAAYTELRTRYGRGEAYADLAAGKSRRRPDARAAPPPSRVAPAGTGSERGGPAAADPGADGQPVTRFPAAASPVAPRWAPAVLASRARRGRPAILALRVAIAAGISAAAFVIAGAQPAAGGVTAGLLSWLLLTARHDLAPPGS
jgi:curved DNA-binding protein CbpA